MGSPEQNGTTHGGSWGGGGEGVTLCAHGLNALFITFNVERLIVFCGWLHKIMYMYGNVWYCVAGNWAHGNGQFNQRLKLVFEIFQENIMANITTIDISTSINTIFVSLQ